MTTIDQVEARVREVAQTQASQGVDIEMFRRELRMLAERVGALENRAGTASQLAPAPRVSPPYLPPLQPPAVGPGPARPPSFDAHGYQVYVDDPLRAFMAGESTVARAIAKHKFDITIGNRQVTPLDTDYGTAYHMSGKFAGVAKDLQRAWLLAILQDAGAASPPPPWYLAEFGQP
jgi:hypothetical protein